MMQIRIMGHAGVMAAPIIQPRTNVKTDHWPAHARGERLNRLSIAWQCNASVLLERGVPYFRSKW
jgi:hypothetical protein